MRKAKGCLISFEGCEGVGKSTQAGMLNAWLREQGIPAIAVREPGSTPLGRELRKLLKGGSLHLCGEAELMLFAAARAQMMQELVMPALSRGMHVVADRYADSTEAYQGGGRGIALEKIQAVRRIATFGAEPELAVLLDAPLEEIRERLAGPQMPLFPEGKTLRVDPDGERRFEQEGQTFHQRVRARYLSMAQEEPGRWLVLDAMEETEKLAQKIRDRVWETIYGPGAERRS